MTCPICKDGGERDKKYPKCICKHLHIKGDEWICSLDGCGTVNKTYRYTCRRCNINRSETERSFDKYYKSFFEYFLDFHAIQCTRDDCICRASTFMDMICEKELRGSQKYGLTIEEVLARDR